MIAVAFLGLAVGYLLIYSGITNRNPKKEIVANLHGGHADKEDGSGGSDSGAPGAPTGTGDSPLVSAGKMKMLPPSLTTHPGILVDAGIWQTVVTACRTFGVKVSSGYSLTGHVAGSDHRCGGAGDFVGKEAAMRSLYEWAQGKFAYVEPWSDSMTVGVLGTTGKHVHISFFRCPTHERKT